MLERTGRVLDDGTKREWLADTEHRLHDILVTVKPSPMVCGYEVERSRDGLTIFTMTGKRVAKREIGLLSAGVWPCWSDIVKVVPEFDLTPVVFDAIRRYEWSRSWSLADQERRLQNEYGIYA